VTTKTLLYMTAVTVPPPSDESALEVDVSDLEEEDSTVPFMAPPERTTERPSHGELSALCHATRVDAPWLAEPVFALDPESCRLVLARPYLAEQRDRWGNLFRLECPVGAEVDLPTSLERARALRSELVRASLRVAAVFRVVPHSGGVELTQALDQQWREDIAEAFALGDAGALVRG
jgi:hypothetical protein